VYGARPPTGGWTWTDPEIHQAHVDAMEGPEFVETAPPAGGQGSEAVVETYTVAFDREGEPEQGIVIG